MASRPAVSSALAASSTCTLNIGVPSCRRSTASDLVCVKQEGTPRLHSGGASTGIGYNSSCEQTRTSPSHGAETQRTPNSTSGFRAPALTDQPQDELAIKVRTLIGSPSQRSLVIESAVPLPDVLLGKAKNRNVLVGITLHH